MDFLKVKYAESSIRFVERGTSTRAAELKVKVVPLGPSPGTINRISSALVDLSSVQKYLKRTRNRLLSFAILDPPTDVEKAQRPGKPGRYLATIYDYTNNRSILVNGRLNALRSVEVSECDSQPLPNDEEFAHATKVLLRDSKLGPEIRAKNLQPYRPMPPLIPIELPDGRVERTLAIGLLPREGMKGHEIVGVNMIHETVIRFEHNAPEGSAAHNPICGLSNAGQPTARNTPGQAWITVTQAGTVLWRFLVVRPAASSGTNGSGVELRYVDYRGKRVLYRAHAPILNVKYQNNACGPYRDWQNQESMIKANGTDVAPGLRLCPAPAKTILDSGSDTGNYLGVAIYVQGLEVVLVSEMEAGWYRYISEWRLHADGTIRPRFGFSGTRSSCVCTRHYHHAYWRLDFDIRTAANNRVREYNNPRIFPNSNWHTKYFEIRRPRDPKRNRKWLVENTVSGEAYEIIPGGGDGVATASPDWPFPRGDVWILRYRGSEIDDGVQAIGPPYEAGLDGFVSGEAINNQDVVIWYAAHVTHDVTADPPGVFGHIAGPDLRVVRW